MERECLYRRCERASGKDLLTSFWQNGKQGEVKNVADANAASMAEAGSHSS